MSHFKETLRKLMQEANEEAKAAKAAHPEKDLYKPVSKSAYLIGTFGFLLTVFLLLVIFGTQTIFHSDYGMTIGSFTGDDLHYTANGQQIVKKDSRDYTYRFSTNNRRKTANSTRFFVQVINYEKASPEKFVFTFGLGGDLTDPGHSTLHNYTLLIIIALGVANFFFAGWAYSDRSSAFIMKGNEGSAEQA